MGREEVFGNGTLPDCSSCLPPFVSHDVTSPAASIVFMSRRCFVCEPLGLIKQMFFSAAAAAAAVRRKAMRSGTRPRVVEKVLEIKEAAVP